MLVSEKLWWYTCVQIWPDIFVLRRDGLLKELELVQVQHDDVSGAVNGHQDAHAAEDEGVEGPAEGPPRAQEEEDGEVDEWS